MMKFSNAFCSENLHLILSFLNPPELVATLATEKNLWDLRRSDWLSDLFYRAIYDISSSPIPKLPAYDQLCGIWTLNLAGSWVFTLTKFNETFDSSRLLVSLKRKERSKILDAHISRFRHPVDYEIKEYCGYLQIENSNLNCDLVQSGSRILLRMTFMDVEDNIIDELTITGDVVDGSMRGFWIRTFDGSFQRDASGSFIGCLN